MANKAVSGMIGNYEGLINAIIISGATIVISARNRLARKEAEMQGSSSHQLEADVDCIKREVYILERFFNSSEWFGLLPNLEGKYILENLRKEFEQ